MNPHHGTIVPPAAVLLPHRRPGRKIVGQGPPSTAILRLIEDGIPHLAQRIGPRRTSTPAFGRRHGRTHDLPLLIRQVGRVFLPLYTGDTRCRDFVYSLLKRAYEALACFCNSGGKSVGQ